MAPESEGDWGEYRRLILAELTRLNDGISEVKAQIAVLRSDDISEMKAEIAVLKFKAGVWGLLGGLIPAVVAIVYASVKA